jgi:hypothetical protein
MIHYHGTPITPNEQMLRMAGRHFCVSFAYPQQFKLALQIGQSVMFDNGAFSAYTAGTPFDEAGYYKWLEPVLAHPHWAVVPDVIGGSIEQQAELAGRWPHGREFAAPVWHLGLPFGYLFDLVEKWPRICLGSSAEYWDVGGANWCRRMDETFNVLAQRYNRLPWLHGLRMLGMGGERWPLASADSTNVAQNHKRDTGCAECKARVIDAVQCPTTWNQTPTQRNLCL